LSKSTNEKEEHEQQLTEAIATIRGARENIVTVEQQSADVRRSINQCQGSLSSMEALQEAALGKTDKAAQQWLEKSGIDKNSRFAEKLDVTGGWELAVETVLGDTLEAICVDDINQYSSELFCKNNIPVTLIAIIPIETIPIITLAIIFIFSI
jgi:chromosome segregation protein